MNNTVTFISGKTGSGKTLLALTAAMHLVDTYKYDRVVIASNPVAVRGVQALGYLPGTVNDKLLSGALGNILTSKFGDRMQVEMLIQQGKIRLLDLAACRGSEIKDNEILFLTEFENVTVDMAKSYSVVYRLAQRCLWMATLFHKLTAICLPGATTA